MFPAQPILDRRNVQTCRNFSVARSSVKTHYTGRYLSLVERDGWEYATRNTRAVVVIVAWRDDDHLLLVEQYRTPIAQSVVELPAGLVGDQPGQDQESLLEAARRELLEETGYCAGRLVERMRCPTSAGLSDEIVAFIEASSLSRTGPGGGDDSEDIVVHAVRADDIDAWLLHQQQAGKQIDPKIYAALYWRLRARSATDPS